MTRNILATVIEKLVKTCEKNKIELVIMGGIAVSLFARPRATYDIDGIIFIEENQINSFLVSLNHRGFKYDKKKPVKFIQTMPFITLYYSPYKTYLDLFIAKGDFLKGILKRAKIVSFGKLTLKVVSPEDLILIKLQSGRERDTEDIRELIKENINKLDFKYLKNWSTRLGIETFLNDELRSLNLLYKGVSRFLSSNDSDKRRYKS